MAWIGINTLLWQNQVESIYFCLNKAELKSSKMNSFMLCKWATYKQCFIDFLCNPNNYVLIFKIALFGPRIRKCTRFGLIKWFFKNEKTRPLFIYFIVWYMYNLNNTDILFMYDLNNTTKVECHCFKQFFVWPFQSIIMNL